tara:strand:+ start:1940 stop:2746 length:807 start_codon:yes stop_codon:yes gene_type:complete
MKKKGKTMNDKYKLIKFDKNDIGHNDNVLGIAKIYDYSVLENAEGNRNFLPKAIKDVRDSVANLGFISCPIAVQKGKKFIIIDGWHRKYVAEETKSTLTIILVNVPDINDAMIALDTTQHNWKPIDYLNNGIVYHKNEDYIIVREVMEDYGLAVNAVYNLYSCDRSVAVNKGLFEKGRWTISTKGIGNKTIKYADELNKYMLFSMSSNFLHGFVKCVKKSGYNQKQMIDQCKRFPHHIHDCHNPSDFVSMLNRLYNHCVIDEEQTYLA